MSVISLINHYGTLIPADKETSKYVGKLKTGDIIQAEFKKKRNPKFHRKYFALLNFAFEHWENDSKEYKGVKVEPSFERFREDLTILSGHYTATFDINGDVRLKAKSISFAKMDETEFNELYQKTINVIIKKVLINYNENQINSVVEQILGFT